MTSRTEVRVLRRATLIMMLFATVHCSVKPRESVVIQQLRDDVDESLAAIRAIQERKQNLDALCKSRSTSSSPVSYSDEIQRDEDNSTVSNDTSELEDFSITLFSDCSHVFNSGYVTSGIYPLWLREDFRSLFVLCDMDTVNANSSRRGWEVIQRRMNGEINFDRGWDDYVHGFGSLAGEFWIGLETMHQLATQRKIVENQQTSFAYPELRIDLEDWDGVNAFAEYERFQIASAKDNFRLILNGASRGDAAGASSQFIDAANFSTFDVDHDDQFAANMAHEHSGGWWFSSHSTSFLNGPYPTDGQSTTGPFMKWTDWNAINPRNAALRNVAMKLQL